MNSTDYTIVLSIIRRQRDFHATRGRMPKYLLLDGASYLRLRHELGADLHGAGSGGWHVPVQITDISQGEVGLALEDAVFTEFRGMKIIVVPLSEMLAVVGEPWEEALRFVPNKESR